MSFCHLVPPQDTMLYKVLLSDEDTKWHNVCHLKPLKTDSVAGQRVTWENVPRGLLGRLQVASIFLCSSSVPSV